MILTPKACSVHTHADLCDGRDSLEAMAAAAFDACHWPTYNPSR